MRPHILALMTFAAFLAQHCLFGFADQKLPDQKTSDSPQITDQQVHDFVKPFIDSGQINAISVGIVQPGQDRIYHFGALSESDQSKPTDQTIYEIGSISKVFTSILLADATESGKLNLDSPLEKLLPAVTKANPTIAKISLKQLATHTSGLPRLPDNMNPAAVDPYANYNRANMDEFLSIYQMPADAPASSQYSNLAVGLLGELVATKQNQTYEGLLKSRICVPLQMHDTTITLSDSMQKRFAPPHNADGRADKPWTFQAIAGAGAIRSTASDMVKFIHANLDPPKSEVGRAIDLAWQEHAPARGNGFAMGLGWHIARDGSTRWHNGQTGGYHSMMLINRSMKSGVIVMANTALKNVDKVAESMIQIMAGIDVQPPEFDTPVEVESASVARLDGRYQIAPGFVLTVRSDKAKLFAQLTGQAEFRVYPESETRWKYRVVDATLEFNLPTRGKASSVTLFQNGQEIPGKRIR